MTHQNMNATNTAVSYQRSSRATSRVSAKLSSVRKTKNFENRFPRGDDGDTVYEETGNPGCERYFTYTNTGSSSGGGPEACYGCAFQTTPTCVICSVVLGCFQLSTAERYKWCAVYCVTGSGGGTSTRVTEHHLCRTLPPYREVVFCKKD